MKNWKKHNRRAQAVFFNKVVTKNKLRDRNETVARLEFYRFLMDLHPAIFIKNWLLVVTGSSRFAIEPLWREQGNSLETRISRIQSFESSGGVF